MNNAAAWTFLRSGRGDVDEATLILEARVEPEVFGELYVRHAGRLYSYLRARIGNDEDAADLTQQVFFNAFDAFPQYEDRGLPFAAWLFRIAHNAVADAYRRRSRSLSWDSVQHEFAADDNEAPDTALLRQEAYERVRSILGDLPARQRDLILLRFVAGLTLREIGAVVGKSESAIHKQIHRSLRTVLERYDDDR